MSKNSALCKDCGSNMFDITAAFDPQTAEITMYMMDAKCAECGLEQPAPTAQSTKGGLS
jgi:hypothetical protein